MFNITHYERNANQNYNDVSPHTSQNGHCQLIHVVVWQKAAQNCKASKKNSFNALPREPTGEFRYFEHELPILLA